MLASKTSVLPLDDSPVIGPAGQALAVPRVIIVFGIAGAFAAARRARRVARRRRIARNRRHARLLHFLVELVQNLIFHLLARLGVQGMRDVFERAVLALLAGHGDEKSVVAVNNF